MNFVSQSKRLRIDFGYSGTNFYGWAKQPGGLRTVQEELEKALTMLLRQERVFLTVAGRTDAGVHARTQTCHLDIDVHVLEKLYGRANVFDGPYAVRRINGSLKRNGAKDIVVHRVEVVTTDFDARFSAIARRYEYRLAGRDAMIDPLALPYTALSPDRIDFELLQEASQVLVGLRDFGTFCKAREGATTIRELQEFEWASDKFGVNVARLKADAFCHSMVRTLVGGVVAVSSGRVSMEQFQAIVESKNRTSLFRVMPPEGLSLEEVYYPEPEEWGARAAQTRAKRPQEK